MHTAPVASILPALRAGAATAGYTPPAPASPGPSPTLGTARVLVAVQPIAAGTSGRTIIKQASKLTRIPRNELVAGAVTKPSTIAAKVTRAEIPPGQQIAAADFRTG